MSPKNAAGQTQSSKPRGTSGGIGNNHPNPFNPQTNISFAVGDTTNNCANDRQQHAVTMQIRNVLSQLVAVPVLQTQGTAVTTSVPSALGGAPITNLKLECGTSYQGFWDGNAMPSGKEAASGIYIALLFVDGQLVGTHRMFNKK
jgi:hypothetical protein